MNVIHYKKGYKYQLTRRYDTPLDFDCPEAYSEMIRIENGAQGSILTIEAGYSWDGPSGPTLDTKSSMRGSLEHDAFYQLMRNELIPRSLRDEVDSRLERVSLEDGMWKIRASVWEKMLGWFGANNAHPDNKKRELVAP